MKEQLTLNQLIAKMENRDTRVKRVVSPLVGLSDEELVKRIAPVQVPVCDLCSVAGRCPKYQPSSVCFIVSSLLFDERESSSISGYTARHLGAIQDKLKATTLLTMEQSIQDSIDFVTLLVYIDRVASALKRLEYTKDKVLFKKKHKLKVQDQKAIKLQELGLK